MLPAVAAVTAELCCYLHRVSVDGFYPAQTTTDRGQATLFQSRTMASNLEELILIPATSHLVANSPSACCRSWLEGASRTMSSAKRTDKIHWSIHPLTKVSTALEHPVEGVEL
ncbi:hypothetical protein GOODEAATRI_029873, partial [Goodea atripinnis]